jgi:hypothetical protein
MVGVKAPTNVTEACAYVAKVVQAMSEGRVDVDAGIALRDTLTAYIAARTATDIDERLRLAEARVEELMLRNAAVVSEAVGGLPTPPGFEGIKMPRLGPPVIDQPPNNPWASPEPAAPPVEAIKRGSGRPRKRTKPEPGPNRS